MSNSQLHGTGVNSPANVSSSTYEQLLPLFFQEFEKIKAQVQEHSIILPEIKRLQEHITNLGSRNSELELENRRLRELLGSCQNEHTTDTQLASTKVAKSTSEHFIGKSSEKSLTSTSNATMPVAELGTEASAWAMVARKTAQKKSSPKRCTVESAARDFQPITGPVGFGYVYILRSRRMSRRVAYSRLSVFGIDPYRVLDITFPPQSVVGLLVHEQYKVVLAQLGKAKIEVYHEFNPCDPTHLADPSHKNKFKAERLAIAMDIHRNRCCRGLNISTLEIRKCRNLPFQILAKRVTTHDDVIAELTALRNENAKLKAEITNLRSQLTSTPSRTTTQDAPDSSSVFPPLTSTTKQASAAPVSSYSAVAARSASKSVTKKRKLAAGRTFMPVDPSAPRGFEYLYLNRKRKLSRAEVRRNLRLLGFDLSRVLDICFPGPNVIGLLIHVQYKEEVVSLFSTACYIMVKIIKEKCDIS
ncbi:hypothetical protein G6F37_011583 [Rhizopus arrhizus]|nr:hypothetical protein G6F38_011672 [Rhizopus arrhizus]KAG1148554.1 hypothetical protein G6F37_011583 [Rhizopus arrhizus]